MPYQTNRIVADNWWLLLFAALLVVALLVGAVGEVV